MLKKTVAACGNGMQHKRASTSQRKRNPKSLFETQFSNYLLKDVTDDRAETTRKQNSNFQALKKLINKRDYLVLSEELLNRKKKAFNEQLLATVETAREYKKHMEVNVLTDTTAGKCHNHIEGNFHIGSKKLLFYNMKNYYDAMRKDVFNNLPLTFHIKEGLNDVEFLRFSQYFQ
jgi:tubulin monoglycylase TTLL3/8